MDLDLGWIMQECQLTLVENGTDVVVRWIATVGGTQDLTTGAIVGGTRSPQTETLKALVHTIPAASFTTVRLFNEIEVGDMILDFGPDVALEGREQLSFEVAGIRYVQKEVSDRLAKSWDVIIQGQKLLRPVLVKKAT
jgi:hypothetical protein